jgi:hypothetical protein
MGGAPVWTMGMDNGALREPLDPALLGSADLDPSGAFEAGSYQSFTLVYTAGRYGIDDTGSLRVCFRFASDQSNPQFGDPQAAGYTTVEASNRAVLEVRFDPKANIRPWDRTLWIKVVRGYLREGDRIVIRFGDPRQGSPGVRLQTFCEDSFEFRVLVDPIATFNFQPLPEQPEIRIVAGPPERYVAVIPTLRRTGEPFALKVKGEDRWGNPSDRCDVDLVVETTGPIGGAPARVRLSPGQRAVEVQGLIGTGAGEGFVTLVDHARRRFRSNPIRFETEPAFVHFWGDLHGQSEETIGNNSAEAYFRFARDLAFLDACAHQGNDFQITAGFWAELNRLTAAFDEPGRFVALPGYEWSGNTALGGDRNVYFSEEGRTIRRSSHALIGDRSDIATDCTTAAALFEAFAAAGEWDVVGFAHCGGRYADIIQAHDGRFEKSVEVHSSWGTFEWLVHDAFDAGYRVGIVGNSDGHKGRPGASYPGTGLFGAIGGLTCYLMPSLERATLLDCLRRRRHYATTGGPTGRIILDVEARFDADATVYGDDPALGPAEGETTRLARMGDIVHLPAGEVTLALTVSAAAPIERVEVFNGRELVTTLRPYGEADLGPRIRVTWEGATYRGRFRQVIWDGRAEVTGDRILAAHPIAFFNCDKTLERAGETGLSWRSVTTGNLAGFDIALADGRSGRLAIETPLLRADVALAEIGLEDHVVAVEGELPRLIRIFRVPGDNDACRFSGRVEPTLRAQGDNPLYVRATLEDGTRAWSSPIYIFRR